MEEGGPIRCAAPIENKECFLALSRRGDTPRTLPEEDREGAAAISRTTPYFRNFFRSHIKAGEFWDDLILNVQKRTAKNGFVESGMNPWLKHT
ncbi:MAG: hypothetical protein PHP59_05355 [Methanofollis sp.]|uniref:hypothetical protein n=1 Tax=Methanofollis sp. TaxID=2052835 RepID=UPI002623D305|nr:hypothetical protein [Methanofollis sp.]MDD4254787.1 hypothetical protein [Methanofollis sp.]